jgi:hypothetical protein
MQRAAVGFRVHSGWTALVAVALDNDSPQILLRRRPQLVKSFTFEFRQPYHTAEKRPFAEAGEIIARAESEAAEFARQAVDAAQRDLSYVGYKLDRCALLLASGRPLPALDRILASHALIHTADGELFRKALLDAGHSCGLKAFTLKENALLETASQTLRQEPGEFSRRLTALGSGLGPPWSQDEKFSALAAWLALLS